MEASRKKSPEREPSPRSPEDPPEVPLEGPPSTDLEPETTLRNSASIENIPRIVILTSPTTPPAPSINTEVLHTIHTEEQFPREDQSSSSVLFPPPTNSEDVQNENHLVLTRVLDTSIWDIPTTDTTDTSASSVIQTETAEQNPPETEATEPEPEDLQEQIQIQSKSKETETDPNPVVENPSEPHCVHIIAEWPSTNADFEVLSKLDDECISQDPFLASHQVSGIFDPKDWFIQLSDDEDVPPERRLRHNPGQFCLTSRESWTYFEDNEEDYDEPDH
jgi:hypothetical protein